jgi:hypothetical protein
MTRGAKGKFTKDRLESSNTGGVPPAIKTKNDRGKCINSPRDTASFLYLCHSYVLEKSSD